MIYICLHLTSFLYFYLFVNMKPEKKGDITIKYIVFVNQDL